VRCTFHLPGATSHSLPNSIRPGGGKVRLRRPVVRLRAPFFHGLQISRFADCCHTSLSPTSQFGSFDSSFRFWRISARMVASSLLGIDLGTLG